MADKSKKKKAQAAAKTQPDSLNIKPEDNPASTIVAANSTSESDNIT